jgi:hypothetical protein
MELGETLLTALIVSALAAWVGTVVLVLIDVFGSPDLSGPAKAGWTLAVGLLIWVGVVAYLLARGRGLRERQTVRVAQRRAALARHSGDQPDPAHEHHDDTLGEAITMGLYLSIVLLTVLVGLGGSGDGSSDVALLWGTTVGLLLAHWFATRLTRAFVRARPLPTREEARTGFWLIVAGAAVTGLATVPYLLDINVLTASTAASLVLMLAIGTTGFASVLRGGGTFAHALAFAALAVAIAAIVVAVKYQLAH